MVQISRVLAAVDFSAPARAAFDYALALSKEHRARLITVQAAPLDRPFSADASERLELEAELRARAGEEDVELKYRVQQGEPAAVILLHARALRADVIVVGTHQRSGVERLRTGSVAERVAAKASAPVLVVPEQAPEAPGQRGRHVVVAVDFTPASDAAVRHALALATGPTDRITLVHVAPGFSSGVPRRLYRYGAAEYQAHIVRDAERRLQWLVSTAPATGATIDTRVVVGDSRAQISRAAETLGADLLVVGAPKRSVLSRALFGSTAARVLKATRVPTLAVPHSGLGRAA